MKRFRLITLCLLAAVVVAVGLFALPFDAEAATASGTCGRNLAWNLDETGTLTISGTGAMTNYGYDSSSPTYSTHPWKTEASSIKTVVIEDGVTSIGNYAFNGCTGLTAITIPASVTSIGSSAIYGCTGLTAITIPASVTSIGSSAFRECTSLTTITIPASVTSIGSSAFRGCTGLTTITIPDSVTSIG